MAIKIGLEDSPALLGAGVRFAAAGAGAALVVAGLLVAQTPGRRRLATLPARA